jgi:hypothetical protein
VAITEHGMSAGHPWCRCPRASCIRAPGVSPSVAKKFFEGRHFFADPLSHSPFGEIVDCRSYFDGIYELPDGGFRCFDFFGHRAAIQFTVSVAASLLAAAFIRSINLGR